MTTSETQLKSFIDRHRKLLLEERDAEIERSSLLLSNCGPKLLEQKGLALAALGVVGVNVGLGGKTCILASCLLRFKSNRFLIYCLEMQFSRIGTSICVSFNHHLSSTYFQVIADQKHRLTHTDRSGPGQETLLALKRMSLLVHQKNSPPKGRKQMVAYRPRQKRMKELCTKYEHSFYLMFVSHNMSRFQTLGSL